MVIAQGDTTTTFVASLAAFYAKAKFGHVEAGLRTDDKWDPFPEEMNRRMTTRLADLHFAPTTLAEENLLKEGVPQAFVRVTGNTVVDALHSVAAQNYQFDDPALAEAVAKPGRMVLVTAHRRENWGAPMANPCAVRFCDCWTLFPTFTWFSRCTKIRSCAKPWFRCWAGTTVFC